MWSRRERQRTSEPPEGKIKETLQCRVRCCLHIGFLEGFPPGPSRRSPSSCSAAVIVPASQWPPMPWPRHGTRNIDEVRA